MSRPTNFERVMGVVNSTRGKRAASADIAKALKVPVAKLRGWLLEWASMGLLCVNKGGVVSRKRGPRAEPRQLSPPFPNSQGAGNWVALPPVLQSLAFRDEALQRAYPDEATVLTGDNPLLNIFKKEDENA